MNKLLISEEPLVISPELARRFGLKESIIIQQLHQFMLQTNEHEDGYKWVFIDYKKWREQLPFLSVGIIKRVFKKLEKEGIFVQGGRKNWYRID